MAILYYLVFCSALLKPSCYTPRNYFLATDWDAATAVSVSENIHVQWRQQETSQVRYLTPGTPVKLNSRQVNHVSKPDWLRFHCDLISPPGGTITKTLFVCSLFQCVLTRLMGLIQKWHALPQVMSHFQTLLAIGLAGLILIHPTDWLRCCPYIWEYTLVATRNIVGPLSLTCLWSWTSQLCE